MPKGRYAPPPPPRMVDDATMASLISRPGVMVLEYRHDAWCAAQRTQRLEDCTCDVETWLVRPFDTPPTRVQLVEGEVLR